VIFLNNIRIVYFSLTSENTKRFVDKLSFPAERIPLRRNEEELMVDYNYILIVPTYGAGRDTNAVPKQVIKFLRHREHRAQCMGIIGSGNKNFGEHYLLAARILSEKLDVPLLYGFEISGTQTDVCETEKRIIGWWNQINVTLNTEKEDE